MPNIGTPDWQRGTVGAGKLLATVPGTDTSVTVSVPPNAQSLVIVVSYSSPENYVEVKGVTTGRGYTGALRTSDEPPSYGDAWYYFAVSSSLDEQVTVTLAAAPTSDWYVLSETGVTMVDVAELIGVQQYDYNTANSGLAVLGWSWQAKNYSSLVIDSFGRLVPFGPTVGVSKVLAAGTTQLLAAPGSGEWYLFGLDVEASGGVATSVALVDGAGNTFATVGVATVGDSRSVDLAATVTSSTVSVTASAAATVTLRYTPGP